MNTDLISIYIPAPIQAVERAWNEFTRSNGIEGCCLSEPFEAAAEHHTFVTLIPAEGGCVLAASLSNRPVLPFLSDLPMYQQGALKLSRRQIEHFVEAIAPTERA